MNNIVEKFKKGSKIHIKESQKGSFTRYCKGNVTDECIQKGKNSPDPKIRKKATFAANVRKWKHKQGGKAFVSNVNVLDSNPDMYRKKRKTVKAAGGWKTTWDNISKWGKENKDVLTSIGKGLGDIQKSRSLHDAAIENEKAINAQLQANRNQLWLQNYQNALNDNTLQEGQVDPVTGSIINTGEIVKQQMANHRANLTTDQQISQQEQEMKQQINNQYAKANQATNDAWSGLGKSIFDGLGKINFGSKKATDAVTPTGMPDMKIIPDKTTAKPITVAGIQTNTSNLAKAMQM